MTNLGDEITEYNGQPMAIKDIPDPGVRRLLGYGHETEGRQVITVPGRTWETTPDICTYGSMNWEWITIRTDSGSDDIIPHFIQAQFLVCPKCGLDGT